jgi:hypothetical protein
MTAGDAAGQRTITGHARHIGVPAQAAPAGDTKTAADLAQ